MPRKFSRHRGPRAYQNIQQLVRAHFGLSQPDVARLLHLTRATVAMDERGERSMPTAAWFRFHHLTQVLPVPDGPAPVPAPAPLRLSEQEQDTLRLRLKDIEREEYPLRQKLTRCQTQLAQARLRLQALPALHLAYPDERGQQWLADFAAEAHEVLDRNSGTPAILALRLRVLAFEAAEIVPLLAEAAPPTK
ncbi:helix-turn-helix domain-containing protein [Hymenobacter chitinivorans]|uniref:Helix-turn-helix protein n=1 Tax=Hymenobacter chitinivorans DSM 11115 TaxID=1121954 RepID=A0A2M9BTM9_9BACT|nr:helix-turn-helix domain-containing protein [Hymenobacter chitinivorans]PJJ61293.1 hypothetical protein CLV45_2731 [Hymenobacter chitinivorans DSM 11115]